MKHRRPKCSSKTRTTSALNIPKELPHGPWSQTTSPPRRSPHSHYLRPMSFSPVKVVKGGTSSAEPRPEGPREHWTSRPKSRMPRAVKATGALPQVLRYIRDEFKCEDSTELSRAQTTGGELSCHLPQGAVRGAWTTRLPVVKLKDAQIPSSTWWMRARAISSRRRNSRRPSELDLQMAEVLAEVFPGTPDALVTL